MFGTIARLALMRFLPRRVVPLLTAWEVIRLVRARRGGGNAGTTTTDPRARGGRR